MFGGDTFVIRAWNGDYAVTRVRGAGASEGASGRGLQEILFRLRHDFVSRDRAVQGAVEAWYAREVGPLPTAVTNQAGRFGAGPWSPGSAVAAERVRLGIWERFERALRSGEFTIRLVEEPPLVVTLKEVPALPVIESAREAQATHFEATIVDEVGQPLAGLEMVLTCEGRSYDLTTNSAGLVRQDGVTASRASLRVKSAQQLRDIIEPRWSSVRSGAFPQAANLLRAELSDSLDSFSLAAEEEHLIVITPRLGNLHVEWWDGPGKHRHVECSYQVSGPRSFNGKTDKEGQLLHSDVPLGEYTVTLTVEYFKGRSYAKTLTFDEKVEVTKAGGLQVRRVGPTPEVAFRRTRGYLFDKSKAFLMPRAARLVQETAQWWENRAPSHLLIVGHTDVTGNQAVNDVLSQARADAVKAFLEQDVDAWLAFYDEQGATKWGSREDRLMIRSLPDFATRLTVGETASDGAANGVGSGSDASASSRTNGVSSSSSKGGTDGTGSATATDASTGATSSRANNTTSSTKPKPRAPETRRPETIVEWFQRTRGLEVDDIAGPRTRRALVSEYMGVGTVALRETPGCPVSIATLGEGEDYPLAETGLPLDVKVSGASGNAGASSESTDTPANPLDRRVEMFFFDTDFGILPPVGDVGGPEYIEWRKRAEEESDVAVEKEVQEAKYLAVRSAQFRTASAVMVPEGDAPSAEGKTPLTSVGMLATALRYNEEHPGHTMLVAGHTDSVGGDKGNDRLSEQRAQLVHAVLTGGSAGRSVFQDVTNETGTVSDWKQILKWASAAFTSVEELVDDEDDAASDAEPEDGALGTGFTACDPGAIDDDEKTGADAVRAFQTAYNENYKLLGGSGKISVDGEVGKQTWGAIYDLYQYNLAQELGETFDVLKELQGLVQVLPTTQPYVGFGESAPADGSYENDADEQVNRRVEVLLFEYGQEPDVALLDEDPHVSELYHGEVFARVEIPGRPGGAKAHGSVLVHLYRPREARGRIAYRVVSYDGNYDRTLEERSGIRSAATDYLTLEFTDVPLTVPIDIEQLSGGRLVVVKGVKAKRALGKVSLRQSDVRTEFNTEPSTRFLKRSPKELLS